MEDRFRRRASSGAAKAKGDGAVRLSAWSYSRWRTYTQCPAKANFQFVQRRGAQGSRAKGRGERLHEEAATYVKAAKKPKLAKELVSLRAELDALRAVKKKVLVEEELAFAEGWVGTGWFDQDAWCRVKCDFVVPPIAKDSLRIIDLKTGKMYPGDRDQVELYALSALVWPWPFLKEGAELEKVVCELWYSDQGEIIEAEYLASEVPQLQKLWAKRTRKMMADRRFVPKPSSSCRYCDFSAAKKGPCEYGA